MSDDLNTPNEEAEASVDESEESEASGSKGESAKAAANPLSRPSDAAARPGFRNPSNKRSKAQKKGKKKR
ncbi:MAG: hypothetical protein H6741_25115 [Alphaproteobacteria bacterium]|nr:hypothetical protein [Alphaproteobacteria bacterium]MCB9795990.1 hypothetical protein [Alphaproteobacteria bacterium]